MGCARRSMRQAGYSDRWVQNLIMRAVDVLMAFPSLLLGLAVLAVLRDVIDGLLLARSTA